MRKNNRLIACALIPCFVGIFSSAHAEDCPITNGPTKELTTYIQSVDKKLEALRAKPSKCGTGMGDHFAKLGESSTKIINRNTNFKNFGASSKFWIDSAINAKFPDEFLRDNALLERQTTKIQKTMDTVYARCGDTTAIDEILATHILVVQGFRSAAVGESQYLNDLTFDASLKQSFIDTYGSSAIATACKNKSKNDKNVSEIAAKIGELGTGFKESLRDWTMAWRLLTGDKAVYDAAEKRLFKKELGRQWVSTERASVMLSCLTASGCNNAGTVNNGYTGMKGFLANIKDRIIVTGDSFVGMYEKIRDDLYDAYATPNTRTYSEKTKEYRRTKQIIEGNKTPTSGTTPAGDGFLASDYEIAKQLINTENTELATGIGHLKMIHEVVNATITDVKGYTDTARKVCEMQAKNAGWNCKY